MARIREYSPVPRTGFKVIGDHGPEGPEATENCRSGLECVHDRQFERFRMHKRRLQMSASTPATNEADTFRSLSGAACARRPTYSATGSDKMGKIIRVRSSQRQRPVRCAKTLENPADPVPAKSRLQAEDCCASCLVPGS